MTVPRSRITIMAAVAMFAAVVAGAAFLWMRPLPVTIIGPTEHAIFEVYGLGTIEARVFSDLGFDLSGTVHEVFADHGDGVKAGGVLARLDSGAQAARLTRAEASTALAEASYSQSQVQLQRARAILEDKRQVDRRRRKLVAIGAVSIEEADQARTDAIVAEADLKVAEKEVDLARAALENARADAAVERVLLQDHTLVAPYDGIITRRHAEPGTVLAAGQPLFTVVDPASIWALVYVDESLAGDLDVGQGATLRLRSMPQTMFRGHVTRIDIESDRVTEERRVYVACGDCPATLHIGEQVDAFIQTGEATDTLFVPLALVQEFDGQSGLVWTLEAGRLAQRRVAMGPRTLSGRVLVVENLPDDVKILAELPIGLRTGRAARATQVQASPAPDFKVAIQ